MSQGVAKSKGRVNTGERAESGAGEGGRGRGNGKAHTEPSRAPSRARAVGGGRRVAANVSGGGGLGVAASRQGAPITRAPGYLAYRRMEHHPAVVGEAGSGWAKHHRTAEAEGKREGTGDSGAAV